MFSSQSAFAGQSCFDASDCDDNNVCTNDSCFGAGPPIFPGTCSNIPNFNSCNDGNECTGGDFCSGGVCAGTPTVLAPCGDTGNECTNQDFCDFNGICGDAGVRPEGTPCGDPTVTECSNANSCNANGVCLARNLSQGTSCDLDTDECTDDACDGSGTCEAGPPITGTPACFPAVGGEIIPIETTSLLLTGAQSFSWMLPVVLSVLGIGLFVVSRKSE